MAEIVQVLLTQPSCGSADIIATRLLNAIASSGRRLQIWMPPHTRLAAASPWRPWLEQGRVVSQLHPRPNLVLVRDATDWRALLRHRFSGEPPPVLHLLSGHDLRHWGHGGDRAAAIRLALSPELAAALEASGRLREPIHSLPIGLDPATLPDASDRQANRVLVLARHRPDLGLILQQQLEQAGLSCRCELEAWPPTRWQQEIAEASTVVNLARGDGGADLGLRRLSSMALGSALVSEQRPGLDSLCRDGRNALVRPAVADQLREAVLSLQGSAGASRREGLINGGLATALRHRTARQELELLQLLDQLPALWREARRCHPETVGASRNAAP